MSELGVVADDMLQIKALDPNASVKFSEYTNQWYVEANIEISDGYILTGGTEHRPTASEAVIAYADMLRGIDLDHVIVARPFGNRRHYRWNGAAFAECPFVRAVAS